MDWYQRAIYKEAKVEEFPKLDIGRYPTPENRSRGLEDLGENLTETDVADISWGLKDNPVSFLGSGSYGAAWGSGSIVKKVTRDSKELKTAINILGRQKLFGGRLPFVVEVYGYRVRATHIEISIERVQSLDDMEKILFSKIYHASTVSLSDNQLNYYYSHFYFEYGGKIPRIKIEKVFRAVQRFLTYKSKYKFGDNDIFYDNVGWRGSNLVVLDLGAISFR